MVRGSGFEVRGLEFRVRGSRFGVRGSRFCPDNYRDRGLEFWPIIKVMNSTSHQLLAPYSFWLSKLAFDLLFLDLLWK